MALQCDTFVPKAKRRGASRGTSTTCSSPRSTWNAARPTPSSSKEVRHRRCTELYSVSPSFFSICWTHRQRPDELGALPPAVHHGQFRGRLRPEDRKRAAPAERLRRSRLRLETVPLSHQRWVHHIHSNPVKVQSAHCLFQNFALENGTVFTIKIDRCSRMAAYWRLPFFLATCIHFLFVQQLDLCASGRSRRRTNGPNRPHLRNTNRRWSWPASPASRSIWRGPYPWTLPRLSTIRYFLLKKKEYIVMNSSRKKCFPDPRSNL